MGNKCGETIRSFGLLFEKSGSFIAFSGVVGMNEEVVKDVIDLDGDGTFKRASPGEYEYVILHFSG